MIDETGIFPGTVIGRETLRELRRQTMSVADANLEAVRIINAANAQAREVVENAKADVAQECAQHLVDVSDEAEQKLRTEFKAIEGELAELVGKTVRSVIGDLDQDLAIERATIMALSQLVDHKMARIRAAPAAMAPLTRAIEAGAGENILEIVEDEELEGDRVVFSSDRAVAEIGLSKQVEAATAPWTDKKV